MLVAERGGQWVMDWVVESLGRFEGLATNSPRWGNTCFGGVHGDGQRCGTSLGWCYEMLWIQLATSLVAAFNMSSLAPLKELQLAAAEAKVPEIEAKVAEARQQRKAAAEAAAAEAAAAEVEAQAAAMEVGIISWQWCYHNTMFTENELKWIEVCTCIRSFWSTTILIFYDWNSVSTKMAHVLICFAQNSMCSHGLCLYSIGAMSWIRNRTNLVFGCTCGRRTAARKRSLGRPGWKVKMSHSRIAIIQHIKLQQMGGFQIWETPPHFNGKLKDEVKEKIQGWRLVIPGLSRSIKRAMRELLAMVIMCGVSRSKPTNILKNWNCQNATWVLCPTDLCAMQATHVNSWLPNFCVHLAKSSRARRRVRRWRCCECVQQEAQFQDVGCRKVPDVA